MSRQLKQMFGIGREDLTNLSWVQPTCSALLLIPQMHVPDKMWHHLEIIRLSHGIRFIAKKHRYSEEKRSTKHESPHLLCSVQFVD